MKPYFNHSVNPVHTDVYKVGTKAHYRFFNAATQIWGVVTTTPKAALELRNEKSNQPFLRWSGPVERSLLV